MIFGIGIDVLDSGRMHKVLARWGDKFVNRLLMPGERAQYELTRKPERFLTFKFGAKEAIVKAMGTGFAHGVWIRDVGFVQDHRGKPEVVYSPRGDKLRRDMGIGDGYVSVTDDAGIAIAVAILMKADARPGALNEVVAQVTAGLVGVRQRAEFGVLED
jgi:holo-[acyl-carrier protein] synthase